MDISKNDYNEAVIDEKIQSSIDKPFRNRGIRQQPSIGTDLSQEKKELSSPSSSTSIFDQSATHLAGNAEYEHLPVVFRYLEFETKLPQPSAIPCVDSKRSCPQAPDLAPYRNPIHWPKARKDALLWLSTIATLCTAYSAGSYAPGQPQMDAEFHVSRAATSVGITSFTAGFGITPMILAPFSEIHGRRPMFMITGFLFFVFVLTCALTPTLAGMIVARFFAGCSSSTFSTIVGGVIADIYEAKERNTPMTIYTGGVLFGTGLGPLVSGFIAQNMNWRWIFWVHLIVVGALYVAIVVIFKETRGSVLLSRKAKALNEWYQERESAGYYGFEMPSTDPVAKSTVFQRIRWKVKADEERSSIAKTIAISLYRPFHLLATEPVVFSFSLWITFAWTVLYLNFSIIPYMFQTVYGFDTQESFAVFTVICVASVITTIYSVWQDKIAIYYGKLPSSPEGRLYFACVEAAFLPIGLFWFGWTSNASIHWIVPALGIGFSTAGIFSVYLAVFNYLADSYHKYASSAIAAQSFCRNVLAGAFPIFTEQMFKKMGFGGGGSFLGGCATVLLLVPWVLRFYGPQIRARSKICSQLTAAAAAVVVAVDNDFSHTDIIP